MTTGILFLAYAVVILAVGALIERALDARAARRHLATYTARAARRSTP